MASAYIVHAISSDGEVNAYGPLSKRDAGLLRSRAARAFPEARIAVIPLWPDHILRAEIRDADRAADRG